MVILLIKTTLFAALLVYASYSDIRRHEVPYYVPAMIAMAGLISVTNEQIILRIFAALLVVVPLVIVSMLRINGLGGADLLLLAAGPFTFIPYISAGLAAACFL